MKTGDLVKKFGVSDATIRRWASTFNTFLSTGEGRHRNFTYDDFLVMATIHQLSGQGYTLELIQQKLKDGYRIEENSIDQIGYPDGRMVPAAVVEQVIDASEIRVQLEQIKSDRDRLITLLQQAQEKLDQMEREARQREEAIRREKDTQIEALQSEIKELQRALGRAEGRLEEIERTRPKEGE